MLLKIIVCGAVEKMFEITRFLLLLMLAYIRFSFMTFTGP